MTEFRPSRFQILPPVIKNLVIINVLVFLAQNVFRDGAGSTFSIDDTFALHAWQSELFKPWQLLTHLFMHGNISHILLNMLALWMFGSVLENLWGSKRFLTFYIICGLGAALIHLLFLSWEFSPLVNDYAEMARLHAADSGAQVESMIHFIRKYGIEFNVDANTLFSELRLTANPATIDRLFEQLTRSYELRLNNATIGASGAVFGILAAFGYLFPNTYLYVYMLIPIKAKWAVLIYAAFELYEGIQNSAGDNVAHWAHIGGGLVGLLIVITWNKTNKKTFY